MMQTLHVITDDSVLSRPAFAAMATGLLDALHGRVALHLRTRLLPASELFQLAGRIVRTNTRASLLINDRVDVAAAVRAGGVQLTVRSLPIPSARAILGAQALIGYSAHSAAEAARAEADGANFVVVGTIYRTETHPERQPAGVELISSTAQRCRIPVVAIGGVTAERVRELRAAGAAGVAVIRAVWDADEPVQAASELVRLLES